MRELRKFAAAKWCTKMNERELFLQALEIIAAEKAKSGKDKQGPGIIRQNGTPAAPAKAI